MSTGVSATLVGPARENVELSAQIRQLLLEVDEEFVPALSSRNDTTSANFDPLGASSSGLDRYVEQTLDEQCIVARVDGKFAGFMTVQVAREHPALEDHRPSTYVVTLAVSAPFRGCGVALALYEAVFAMPSELASPFVATRTWNSNAAHIGLLMKLGFQEVKRLVDDRGPGIDTVYFARRM